MKHIGSFEQLNSMVSDFKSGRGKVILKTEILTYNGKTGYPLHLATSSSHRRKGLGMYVMEEVLRLAVKKEIRTLKCWIEQTNVPSLTLCHRLGYQEDGTVCEQYIMKGN